MATKPASMTLARQPALLRDRAEAGRALAAVLDPYRDQQPLVLGVPRGGIEVARVVADALGAELDVLGVRRVWSRSLRGLPLGGHALPLGVIGEGGVALPNEGAMAQAGVGEHVFEALVTSDRRVLENRLRWYRAGKPAAEPKGRLVIVVDDGILSGATARAAARVVRARGATKVVVAAGVATTAGGRAAGAEVDDLVVVHGDQELASVVSAYASLPFLEDRDIRELLDRDSRARSTKGRSSSLGSGAPNETITTVDIPIAGVGLAGVLRQPPAATGTVVIACAGPGEHLTSWVQARSAAFSRAGMASLTLGLLSDNEIVSPDTNNDVELLGRRLVATLAWLRTHPALGLLPAAVMAGGVVAAAATRCSLTEPVSALACLSGRLDLVATTAPVLRIPTLLIAGSDEQALADIAARFADEMAAEHRVVVFDGHAPYYDGSPASADRLMRALTAWFVTHLHPFASLRPEHAAMPSAHQPSESSTAAPLVAASAPAPASIAPTSVALAGITRLVVPVELASRAKTAVEVARHLARRSGDLRVAVMMVRSVGLPAMPDEHYLRDLVTELDEQPGPHPPVEIITTESNDPPDEAIVAALEPGDLLCMPTNARGPIGELVLSSVSEGVLRHARRPLILVGPHVRANPYRRRMLICVDGPETEQVLPHAKALAARFDLEPLLVQVLPESSSPLGPSAVDSLKLDRSVTLDRSVRLDALEAGYVASLAARFAPSTDFEVLHGDPAHVLVEAIDDLQIALVALTSHARRPLSRLVMGSVALEVTRRASAPVLVVPFEPR